MAQEHIQAAIEQQTKIVNRTRRLLHKGEIVQATFARQAGILSGLKYALRLHRKRRGERMAKRPNIR